MFNNNQLIVNDWQDQLAQRRSEDQSPAAASTVSAVRNGEQYWWGGGITGVFGATPSTGIAFNESIGMTSATAYACTRARAETLASLPPIVYRQVSEVVRERAKGSDPWYLLYDEPNPEMDSMTFYEMMNMRQVNRGNGFAEIERDRSDRPIALWPIHPSRVSPRRDGGRVVWDVFTDVKDLTGNGYKFHTIPDRDMLNICGFGGNGLLAPGVIDMGREEIAIDIASQQYGARWFQSGARPAGVVEYPGYIDDEDQRVEFRADMNRLHSGIDNWNQVAIMWNGAKWKEMQANPQQAQFLETRGFSGRQICRMYNVPPAIVQIFDDYKFNTVDAMIMQFVMTCVRADAVRMERAFYRKVLSVRDARGRLMRAFDDEYFLEFLLEGLLRGDAKKQAETLEIKRRNGIVNANEWRAIDNQNPIGPQGDKYVLPGGFGDLATLGAIAPSKPAAGGGGSDNASADDQTPHFTRQRVIEAVSRNLKPHRNQVRGHRPSRANSRSRNRLNADSAIIVLTEAVDRIEGVLANELSRLASKNQQPTPSLWEKHAARLKVAVLPACKVYARYRRDLDEQAIASELAVLLVVRRQKEAEDICPLAECLKLAAKLSVGRQKNHG
ncbi:MAG: phage portal protein [Aureliella sp.]